MMHSADEELGTIDNLSLNQLEAEGESTVLIGTTERERIDTYEQTEDTSKDAAASVDADVTSCCLASCDLSCWFITQAESQVRLDNY